MMKPTLGKVMCKIAPADPIMDDPTENAVRWAEVVAVGKERDDYKPDYKVGFPFFCQPTKDE